MSDPVTHVYKVYVRTTPERLWTAIVDPKETTRYFFGTEIRAEATTPGADVRWVSPDDGEIAILGTILAFDPPRRFEHTFRHEESDPVSNVAWEIEQHGPVCRLRITHTHDGTDADTMDGTRRGWPIVFSGLKTLIETGAELDVPSGAGKVRA